MQPRGRYRVGRSCKPAHALDLILMLQKLHAFYLARTPLPPFRMAITADATTKSCHYAAAGSAQRNVMPTTSSFLGDFASKVQHDFDTGVLTSAALQRQARSNWREAAGWWGCVH